MVPSAFVPHQQAVLFLLHKRGAVGTDADAWVFPAIQHLLQGQLIVRDDANVNLGSPSADDRQRLHHTRQVSG